LPIFVIYLGIKVASWIVYPGEDKHISCLHGWSKVVEIYDLQYSGIFLPCSGTGEENKERVTKFSYFN